MTLCVAGIEKEMCQKMEKDGSAMTVSSCTWVGGQERGECGAQLDFFQYLRPKLIH